MKIFQFIDKLSDVVTDSKMYVSIHGQKYSVERMMSQGNEVVFFIDDSILDNKSNEQETKEESPTKPTITVQD